LLKGQAELFRDHVTWKTPMMNEKELKKGWEWVVKVFKKGNLVAPFAIQPA
jgi:hypothetical protein